MSDKTILIRTKKKKIKIEIEIERETLFAKMYINLFVNSKVLKIIVLKNHIMKVYGQM